MRTWRNGPVIAVLCAVAILMPACSSEDSPADPVAAIDRLPMRCTGLGAPPATGEITFIRDGHMYAAGSDGGDVRCLGESQVAGDMEWGGRGDRVLFRGEQTLVETDEFNAVFGAAFGYPSWTRPTGTSLIGITDDGGLIKTNVTNGDQEDVSFLDRHDEVVYHPAGTHFATVGVDEAGNYGIFFATNLGADAQIIAQGEDAERIYSLVFSHDGEVLYFAADHGDHFDLHSLRLVSGRETNSADRTVVDTGLRTPYSGALPVDDIVVSEFSTRPLVAFRRGCSVGNTNVLDSLRGQPTPLGGRLADLRTVPIGWLPDGSLALLAYEGPRCSGSADLWVEHDGDAILLVEGVDAAAVRSELPPPPKPPEAAPQVVA